MDPSRREALLAVLTEFFGSSDEVLLKDAASRIEWLELKGGETLIAEGQSPEAVYFVVTGRLRSFVTAGGPQEPQTDFTRAEIVGESSVLLGQPHRHKVIAVRDTVAGRLSADHFHELWRHPAFSLRISRSSMTRLMSVNARTHRSDRRVICVVPITDGVDTGSFGESLESALRRWGSAVVEDRSSVNGRFGDGAANARPSDSRYHRLSVWLDEMERERDFVVLVADDGETEWTRRCIRHADEILFIARSDSALRIHPIEERLCTGSRTITAARQSLVLLHPEWRRHPSDTAQWVDRRPIDAHFHVRGARATDFARLARILTGNAVGLVLSGGGARGFAHIGAFKALEEAGIAVDFVGGTSIGAVMAGVISFDVTAAELIACARTAFSINVTGDWNLLPMLSLIRGGRMRKAIRTAVVSTAGGQPDILDSWLTYFCVASSFSRAREVVLTRGPMDRAMIASVSIPVALPAVPWDGELLVDGGVFNSFPADVMTRMGASRLIGVDLSRRVTQRYDFDEMPGTWQLLFDRKRRNSVPGLGATMVGTPLLYNESRREQSRQAVDVYINPQLSAVGLLDWKALEPTVELGYRETIEVLTRMSSDELAPYRRAGRVVFGEEAAAARLSASGDAVLPLDSGCVKPPETQSASYRAAD
ncbi:MAG TPA: patatin-like phospholipase family protein [Thermoanaerobaculia bacterium]